MPTLYRLRIVIHWLVIMSVGAILTYVMLTTIGESLQTGIITWKGGECVADVAPFCYGLNLLIFFLFLIFGCVTCIVACAMLIKRKTQPHPDDHAFLSFLMSEQLILKSSIAFFILLACGIFLLIEHFSV